MLKLTTNITSFFIGQNSHKRERGLMVAGVLMVLQIFGVLDNDTFTLLMKLNGLFLGVAFSAKMDKMTKQTLTLGDK